MKVKHSWIEARDKQFTNGWESREKKMLLANNANTIEAIVLNN